MSRRKQYARHITAASVMGFAAALAPAAASAHAFGNRYELPVPVWLFVVGGALTVTVTFLLVYFFVRTDPERYAGWRRDLRGGPIGRVLRHPAVIGTVKFCSVCAFALVFAAGFAGVQDPNKNIVPTLVWVIWWVGFSYVAMMIGNPWPALNPWRSLFQAVNAEPSNPRPYPDRIGAWPAVAMLLGFAWIEQVFPFGAKPAVMASLATVFSVYTWFGMRRYGTEPWLAHADAFHIVFDLYSRFAPIGRGPTLRLYGADLLSRADAELSISKTAFVMAMLSTVMFDGLLGSAHWVEFENFVHAINPKLSDFGWIAVHTVALAGTWVLFFGAYLGTCWAMNRMAGDFASAASLARRFALTLIPITIGYHFAHTFSYLLIQGQQFIPLASDPFGFGWNLFGTRGYRTEIAIMTTKAAWYLAVSAIVVGHVVSVYLAHVAADRLLPDRRKTMLCLVPMTALMVVYTVVSLMILAEPLVRYSGPNNEIM